MSGLLARFVGMFFNAPERAAEKDGVDGRRSHRVKVSLPLKASIIGAGVQFGAVTYRQTINGHTRDLSGIGVSAIFPDAPLKGLDLTGEHRRIRLAVELSDGPVEIFATTAHSRHLYTGGAEGSWLIGGRITKMSHDDRGKLIAYLGTLGHTNEN